METKWILNQTVDKQQVAEIVKVLNIDENLATLLVQRGISNYEEAKTFFRPSLSQLHDPFLMKDMDKAVERVLRAIEKGEKVLVYGDYDVDGTTAVAVVYSYLKPFFKKKKIEFYIPDRYEEGYGISYKGIDYAADNGFKLVIALDCGIKAVERVDYANSKGVATITVPVRSSRTLWLCLMPSAPTATILTMNFRVAAWASSWLLPSP